MKLCCQIQQTDLHREETAPFFSVQICFIWRRYHESCIIKRNSRGRRRPLYVTSCIWKVDNVLIYEFSRLRWLYLPTRFAPRCRLASLKLKAFILMRVYCNKHFYNKHFLQNHRRSSIRQLVSRIFHKYVFRFFSIFCFKIKVQRS